MTKTYDLVVIGSGTAAQVASARVRAGGWTVAVIDHQPFGGTCALRGCDPKNRMLPAFDPDLVGWPMDKFHELGIDVCTRATVDSVNKTAVGIAVTASIDGQPRSVVADLAVHAAGRRPDLDDLDLAAADVAVDRGRLKLNEFLQSVSNPRIYAAGDAVGHGPPLTPVSGHDGKIVAANLLEGNHHTPDYRARRLNEPVYGFKTLIEEDTGRILGAHLVGPHAEDDINLFGLAIRHGLSADDLKTTMFAYPTGASDIGDMLQGSV